ncbi:MAG: autotransporter outer membrane beta-barrel domain-containing protein [Methylobacillus glycogenes]|nr:autotransporter outer membrane beta-barrel domain-containing protein [Methylobacillus glycogenes]
MERMQGSAYYGTDDNNQVWFSPSPYAHIGRNSGQGSVRDSAYEQKGGGIAFGIDKAITTERRIGAAVIINNSQIDGKDHSLNSSINNTGVDLAVYGHQSLQDDLTLSVIAKSGYTRAKSSRIDDTELPVRAKSSQDIWHLNLAAELVKTIVKEQLTLSPVLGLEYGSAWVSGYQESGAGYYSLNTERQQAESLIASVGSRVRYQLNDQAQLLGYASVGYDALARASHLRASTEDHRFSVTSADPGNIVTRLGLAYEWRAKAGNYLRANYDYQGRDKGYRDNMLRLDWIVVW